MSTDPRQIPTADALAACRLTAQLLHQAEQEARRRLVQHRSLHAKLLVLELTELTAQAVELLPDQAYPEHDERPRVEETDPLELARQAEELAATLPTEQFPAGLPQLVVRLSRTIQGVS